MLPCMNDVSDDPSLGSVDPAQHPPLAFPDADWAWFLDRCESLGITGAPERRPRLEAIYGHLVGVNRWLNLTRITDARSYLKGHILDSLVALADPRLKHLAEGAPCVDLGSGGGYPGLPLALWTHPVPWVLADARKRKADFLAAAATLVGPQVTARHLRGLETPRTAPDLRGKCQLVTSRAMAQAVEVLTEAAPLLRRHGHCIIYKGPAYLGEERKSALIRSTKLGYRHVADRSLVLEPGDPERILTVFERQ